MVILSIAVSGWGRAQSEETAITNDPDVRFGVLANGLSYYVRANDKPSGKAELRLVVKAGSVNEDEDQLGMAHFVEHMLFNGTEKYPGIEIVNLLESFGIAFGPEVNAYTSFDETVYQLSVSTEDKEQFRAGFDVLEQWAFYATMDEQEYEKERGVIHEEWRIRRGAQARINDETYPVLLKDSLYAERLPIGDMDIVLNAPVQTLRRFYKDWYRPDLMAVIAVGDFDPDKTARQIRERFEGHKNPENSRPAREHPVPRHEETLIKVAHDPEETETNVLLLIKNDRSERQFKKDIRDQLIQELLFTMLNQRLDEISRRSEAPFLYSAAFSDDFNLNTSLTGLFAVAPEESALDSLSAIISESERMLEHGFLPSEFKRAKINLESSYENVWKQRDDTESDEFTNTYLDAFLMGNPFPSIDWYWEALQEYLPLISLAEIQRKAEALFGDSSRVILVTGPSVPSITDIENEHIIRTVQKAQSQSLEPWYDKTVDGKLVENEPQPGYIRSKEQVPGTDIISWTLSNGARVLLKDTEFKEDEILFRALSPGGSSLVDDDEFHSAELAVEAVENGGLADYSLDDLEKILTGKNLSITPYIDSHHEGFSGKTVKDDLETLFQLIYLYHSDALRRDETAWENVLTRTRESLRNRDSSPMNVFSDKVFETIYDNHFRVRPLTLEDVPELDLDTALAVFRRLFEDAGDFTYIFVGDLESTELESLVIKWLAGLPGTGSDTGWVDRGVKNMQGSSELAVESGMEPLSLVLQIWLGDWDGSFAERYRLQSLAAALEMKLTKIIREEYGGTYSIGVFEDLSTIPFNEYRFFIQYSCDPERVEELSSRVLDIVDAWRNEPPEAKFADDVKAHQRQIFAENLEKNAWWMAQISFAVSTSTDPEDMMNRLELYNTLTPEILRSTARTYLNDENYIEAVLYPDP